MSSVKSNDSGSSGDGVASDVSKGKREEIFMRVREIICEHAGLNPSSVSLNSNLTDDLGLDSLDMLELILQFEDSFDVGIEDDDLDTIKTVDDIVGYIAANV